MTPSLDSPTELELPATVAGSTALPAVWVSPRDGTILHLIPDGAFVMGSTAEQIDDARRMDRDGPLFLLGGEAPQFRTDVPAFYLGRFAVTNAQFARFLTAASPTPGQMNFWLAACDRLFPPRRTGAAWRVKPGFETHPVAHVSWHGADAYCRWAGLRLPSEIEWEKGARGTDGRIFPWGDAWDETRLRWHGGDRADDETTAPVDAYPAGCSPYGLFQMAGNVEEWCADFHRRDIYRRYARGDLRAPSSGYGRVVRGGTCLRRSKLEFRCAMRRGNPAAFVNILYTGFRCAQDSTAVMAPPGISPFRSEPTLPRP
jgi:formylglycine-generating enzyme required for sulfatase activity